MSRRLGSKHTARLTSEEGLPKAPRERLSDLIDLSPLLSLVPCVGHAVA